MGYASTGERVTNDAEYTFSECPVCYTFRVSLEVCVLIQKHRQSVVLLGALLLIAAQLVSLVHAADHPFHAEDETCAAFIAFEKHGHAIAVLPATNLRPHLGCETVPDLVSGSVDKAASSYQSRAPPLRT